MPGQNLGKLRINLKSCPFFRFIKKISSKEVEAHRGDWNDFKLTDNIVTNVQKYVSKKLKCNYLPIKMKQLQQQML